MIMYRVVVKHSVVSFSPHFLVLTALMHYPLSFDPSVLCLLFALAAHSFPKTRGTMNASSLLLIYTTYIRPVLEYGSLALSNTTQQQRDTLERIQRRAISICLRIPLFAPGHHTSLLHHAKLPTLSSRLLVKQVLLAWDIHHQTSPPHLQQPHLAPQRQHQPPFDRQGPTPSNTHTQTGTEIPPSTVPSPSTTHSLSTSQPNLVEILSETMYPAFFWAVPVPAPRTPWFLYISNVYLTIVYRHLRSTNWLWAVDSLWWCSRRSPLSLYMHHNWLRQPTRHDQPWWCSSQ